MENTERLGQETVRRHGTAVLLVGLGLALRLWTQGGGGDDGSLILLALSVTLGGWCGGMGPGLLATGLGLLVAVYFFIPPLYSFRIGDSGGWMRLSVFAAEGVLISVLCEARRRSRGELAQARVRERAAQAEAAARAREAAKLEAELARARADLEHFAEALSRGLDDPARVGELVRYAQVVRAQPEESVNCEAVLEEARAACREAIAETGARITHGPLPIIRASRRQVSQLFEGILAGALRHADGEAPVIHLAAGCQGGGWLFRVSHNGPAGDLLLPKRIVEGHGGSFEVKSEPARGTTVQFHIPRRRG